MQIKMQPTDRLVEIGGLVARAWQGETARGVAVVVYVAAIAVEADVDASEFADLVEMTGANTVRIACAGELGIAAETEFKS